jgi:hypothetical protein
MKKDVYISIKGSQSYEDDQNKMETPAKKYAFFIGKTFLNDALYRNDYTTISLGRQSFFQKLP